jgi:hypothetical protein
LVLYTKGSVLSGIGINDELVPHLKWLLAKNDLEALFPSFLIVDTLTLPLIEIGDEKEADLTRTPLFIKQESPKMLFANSPRFDLSLLQRFVSLQHGSIFLPSLFALVATPAEGPSALTFRSDQSGLPDYWVTLSLLSLTKPFG